MVATRTLRVLVAGSQLVARALADAGHEVIYADAQATPEMLAVTALQEGVDAVAVAESASALTAALAARGLGDVRVVEVHAGASPREIVDAVEVRGDAREIGDAVVHADAREIDDAVQAHGDAREIDDAIHVHGDAREIDDALRAKVT